MAQCIDSVESPVAATLAPNTIATDFLSAVTRCDEPNAQAITSGGSSTILIRAKSEPRPDLWQRAWEELKRDDEKLVRRYTDILDSYSKLSANSTLQQKLRAITKERQQEISRREWKIPIGKKPKRDFGTAAAALDPIHAGVPRAGVCVLRPTQDIDNEFEKLVKYLIKAKVQVPEYSEDLDNSLAPQKAHPSLSTWILEHLKYLQWLAGEDDRLWIHGKPGSGKTVLVAVVVDDLYRRPGVLASDVQPARECVGSVFCREY
ncbi:hypothetical protein NA56DRAFT_661898 [Hyaloscypha hepaticicola]|uniref:Nephrocystin 3-like N-terminal domain-containing protein n=1 Tax=Hyaloscypha hepaticicola TaxID=2082293 RepID=A0A2J6PV77_9HELO|nr:hypothetical protein NA56DRAFT_661898 [Hyaloscypha hepaticicola]